MSNIVVQDPIQLGDVLARSGYFSDAKDAAQAAVKVMAGQELGFGPIASMTGVHIIKGKPSVGANLLAALVKKSKRYDYKVNVLTDEECSITIREHIDGEWRDLEPASTFSMQDARKADLTGKDNWRQYPRNMLFARAMSNGVTFHCPDLTGGAPIYTPDELGADTADGLALPEAPRSAPSTAPAPPSTITLDAAKALVRQLVEFISSDTLRLKLKAITGEDPGDIDTTDKAAIAIARLPIEQANELAAWIEEEERKNTATASTR